MRAGRVISGRFLVQRPVGAGAWGSVFRAVDLRGETPVALKVPNGPGARQERSLQDEFRALSRLAHPHVVAPIDLGHDGGLAFLALEFVDGVPLPAAASDPAWPLAGAPRSGAGRWARMRGVLVQLLDALAEVHARGLVHRDLKPAHVLVDRRGDLRLLDFGAALFVGEEGDEAAPSGTGIGAAGYRAPEQADSLDVDARADLFSFGVVAYEVLAGRHPFHDHASRGPRAGRAPTCTSPRASREDVPAAVDRIVDRLLAVDPEDRFATAGEVLRSLADAGVLDGLPRFVPRTAPARRAHRAVLPSLERPAVDHAIGVAAAAALGGNPRVVLLHGGAGMGKSWSLAVAAARLRTLGFHVAGKPGLDPEPDARGTLATVVGGLLGAVGSPRQGVEYGPWVADLAGEPRHRVPDDPDPAGTRALAWSPLLGDVALSGLLRLVRDVSAVTPLALVLDPINEAGVEGLDLMRRLSWAVLAPEAAGARVLLLLGARDAQARALLEGGVPAGLTRVAVGALTRREVLALFSGEPSLTWERERAADQLLRETDGAPDALDTALDAWMRRGWARRTPRGFALGRAFHQSTAEPVEPTPPRFAPLRGIAGLSARARDVACAVAVLGPGVDVDLLRHVLDLSEEDLEAAVPELVSRGVLVAEDGGRDGAESLGPGSGPGSVGNLIPRPRFRVPSQARALAGGLAPEAARHLHDRAARVLRGRRRLEEPGDMERFARHLALAGRGRQAARAFLAVARAARVRGDADRALRSFEAASAAAESAGEARLHIRALRGACEQAVALARAVPGISAAQRLAEVAQRAADTDAASAAARAEGILRLLTGDLGEAESVMHRATGDLAAPGPAAAELWHRRVEALNRAGRTANARRLLEQAILAFRAAGSAFDEARCLQTLALLDIKRGAFRSGMALLDEVEALTDDPSLLDRARVNRALLLLELGEPERGVALIEEALDRQAGRGDLPQVIATRVNLLYARAWLGVPLGVDWDEVVAFCRRADLHVSLGWALLARARHGGSGGTPEVAAGDARAAYRAFRRANHRLETAVARMDLAGYLQERSPDDALHHARRALAAMPADVAPTLAWQFHARAANIARTAGAAGLARERWSRARALLPVVLPEYLGDRPDRGFIERQLRQVRTLAAIADVASPAEVARWLHASAAERPEGRWRRNAG